MDDDPEYPRANRPPPACPSPCIRSQTCRYFRLAAARSQYLTRHRSAWFPRAESFRAIETQSDTRLTQVPDISEQYYLSLYYGGDCWHEQSAPSDERLHHHTPTPLCQSPHSDISDV